MPSGMSPEYKKWIQTENGGVSMFDGKKQQKLFPNTEERSPFCSIPCLKRDNLCPNLKWNENITIAFCQFTNQPCDYPTEKVPFTQSPVGYIQVFVDPVPKCKNFQLSRLSD